MREEEKIFAGQLFFPGDPELKAIKLRAHKLSREYTNTDEDQVEKRTAILDELIGQRGTGVFLQGPIFFHYGKHTTIGNNVFINYNFTVQDDAPVTIGSHCDFGPNVTIVTPIHPMIPEERKAMRTGEGEVKRLCYAKPVTIGNDCWIGANAIICSGVTIGDGCVIGAGSVVVKDIPPHSFAAGNPCRVIREITEADSMIHKPDVLGKNQVL